jgi:hypothetical protein
VVSFTPQPLYPQGKSTRNPLDRWLGGPQSQSRRGGEEEKVPPSVLTRIEPRSSRPQPLHWLSYQDASYTEHQKTMSTVTFSAVWAIDHTWSFLLQLFHAIPHIRVQRLQQTDKRCEAVDIREPTTHEWPPETSNYVFSSHVCCNSCIHPTPRISFHTYKLLHIHRVHTDMKSFDMYLHWISGMNVNLCTFSNYFWFVWV